MAQFADFAFQAAAFSPFAVRADELRHLLKGIVHGLPQIQLPLRAISLREELLPFGPGCACNLLVQIRNLCLQCGNARVGVALELGQRRRCAGSCAAGRACGGKQSRLCLGRLEGQLHHLHRHSLRIQLVHRIAGQACRRHPAQHLPVPVDDCVQMIDDGIAAQAVCGLSLGAGERDGQHGDGPQKEGSLAPDEQTYRQHSSHIAFLR